MDRVGRINEPVQRLLRARPLAVHAQQPHLVVRFRDIDQIAISFHVRLSGENPEVADEEVLRLAREGE